MFYLHTISLFFSSSNADKDIPKSFDCKLITLMETVSGTLTISATSLSFNASIEENTEGSSWDFKIALNELREVHLRTFNHRRSALEFFLLDQTNYFINFTKEVSSLYLTPFKYKLVKVLKDVNISIHSLHRRAIWCIQPSCRSNPAISTMAGYDLLQNCSKLRVW